MWHALQRSQLAAVPTEIELRKRSAELLLSANQINRSVGLQEGRHFWTMTPVSSRRVMFSPSVFRQTPSPSLWLASSSHWQAVCWIGFKYRDKTSQSKHRRRGFWKSTLSDVVLLTKQRLLLIIEQKRKNYSCFVLHIYTELPFYQLKLKYCSFCRSKMTDRKADCYFQCIRLPYSSPSISVQQNWYL